MRVDLGESEFVFELQKAVIKPLSVKINNNRQTFLSVRWEPAHIKLSLHKMFLAAPQSVLKALISYIRREDKVVSREIRAFIEKNILQFDYSHQIDSSKLCVYGDVYDLDDIYTRLNEEYFGGLLHLHITWFGNPHVKNKSRCTLGLYYDSLKLIKIHRYLDDISIPQNVVEYVVFHEMLHAVCRPYVDEKNMTRAHGENFKREEKKFLAYKEASGWLKKNQKKFF